MIVATQESVISYSTNITGLIFIGVQSSLFLLIFLNQGDTESPFLFLLMVLLQGEIPQGAARQGCWYLSINLPYVGIARFSKLLKQVFLEQSYLP